MIELDNPEVILDYEKQEGRTIDPLARRCLKALADMERYNIAQGKSDRMNDKPYCPLYPYDKVLVMCGDKDMADLIAPMLDQAYMEGYNDEQ